MGYVNTRKTSCDMLLGLYLYEKQATKFPFYSRMFILIIVVSVCLEMIFQFASVCDVE